MPAIATPKKAAEKLLHSLPDDSTLEDIQYHLYVLEKIRRGRADVAAGRSFTTDEAKRRLSQWLQP
jgi:predicted transcriptional regulator